MSTAEPFMPAHEPGPANPERDIDGDVDVDFERPDDTETTEKLVEAESADHGPFRPPVPGEHLTRAELEHDLDD